ncbi:hypothetical protein ACHAWF_003087 [Thalassiosira exigua]
MQRRSLAATASRILSRRRWARARSAPRVAVPGRSPPAAPGRDVVALESALAFAFDAPFEVPSEARRSVWATGRAPTRSSHPLDALTPEEMSAASAAAKERAGGRPVRFVAVALREPSPGEVEEFEEGEGTTPRREAEVVILDSATGVATELLVRTDGDVVSSRELPPGTQPLLTPDDCFLAEEIAKSDPELKAALEERYGIADMDRVVGDPWSVHLASEDDAKLATGDDGEIRRLVQTFLYLRTEGEGMECNHYAHPIDLLPIVDLNSKTVVRIDGLDRDPPPKIPMTRANYHRDLIGTNSYLQRQWRSDRLKELTVVQPEGPSFAVSENNLVEWQGWSLRVGFNYREGLVLHDVRYAGRRILNRASLVEMAVPYGDPNPPYTRKCAFDVGDYGLGYCANSLELGCDCLGHIHYFDVCLPNSEGEPEVKKKAICMHEEDDGILWKHVEYRNGHNESRRSRELVISSIATVVNYEYLFYWRLKLDGSIDFEIRLSGELSTNLTSEQEDPNDPAHGVLVAPGVNAQVHQHMFCARLDVAVDGTKNTVSEIDVVPRDSPYGNAFGPAETVLKSEKEAVRACDATKARTWKVSNAEGKVNSITGKATAYKLIPFAKGPAQPTLLTNPKSSVSTKGAFANAHLWVTPFDERERYPAGEYTPQSLEQDGLPKWIEGDRNVEAENVVLWHCESAFCS